MEKKMAVRKLKSLGEIFVDDGGKILVKTKSGNMFTIDDASDLTTIEAKDLLIGDVRTYDDDEEDTRVYKLPFANKVSSKSKSYSANQVNMIIQEDCDTKKGKY